MDVVNLQYSAIHGVIEIWSHIKVLKGVLDIDLCKICKLN